MSPSTVSLRIGETQQFSASITAADGRALAGQSVVWTSSDASVLAVAASGLATGTSVGSATVTAASGGVKGTAAAAVTTPVATVVLTPADTSVVVRHGVQLTVVAEDSAGATVTGVTRWSSSDTTVAVVNSDGAVATRSTGQATITVSVDGKTASTALSVVPGALSVRGLFVDFDERGSPAGYYNGDVLARWDSTDSYVGRTVAAEVAAQMDAMRALGVNTLTMDVRSTDDHYSGGTYGLPECNLPPVLGLVWPTPEPAKLANLVRFLDLAQQKGMRVVLFVVNTHMEQPAATNAQWLGPILAAVGQHPALYAVALGGTTRLDPFTGDCGTPAEAPLWLGPGSTPAAYVQWAIGYGRDHGVSTTKLTAEAVVGYASMVGQIAAPSPAVDGHLWDPIGVMKGIFDNLQIPDAERTYALSFYEHRKCSPPPPGNCVDEDASAWAKETLRGVYNTIGWATTATVVATEFGVNPGDPTWSAAQGVDDLLTLLEKYGVSGGSYYHWVNNQTSLDSDPNAWMPVKLRGYAYSYTPVKDALVRHYLR